MPTIKLKGGKVLLKNGKPSCVCCCNCGGLAGDSPWPLTLYVENHGKPSESRNTFKIGACSWATPATYPTINWEPTINLWVCRDGPSGQSEIGTLQSACSDGPIGQYLSSAGGLLFTVTESP